MPRKQLPPHLRRPPGRPAVYPWASWLDGQSHTIEFGVDYDCSHESMRQQIYIRARTEGVKVQVKRAHDGFVIKAARNERPVGSNAFYNWDKLFDGTVHVLKAGQDFRSTPLSFQSYARQIARSRGHSVSIKQTGDLLLLQAKPRKAEPVPQSEPAPSAEPAYDKAAAEEKMRKLLGFDPLSDPRPFS